MRNGRPTGPRGTGSSRGQTVAARDSGPGDGVLAAGASPGEAWSRAGWRIHLPDEPDPGELARRWGDATIPGLAAASAARHGGKPAITAGAAALTHGRLDREASAVAGWLAQRTGSGDPVLLVKQTGLGFVRWYLGALRAGAIVVLANPAAAAAELEYLLDDSGARLALADPGPAERLAGLNRPGLTVLGDPDLEAALASGRTLDPRPSPDDVAVLGYTSGTTGRPKGAALTHRELLTSIRSVMAAWRWRDDDVLVHALPLFHQHGLGGVHATLIAGSALALVPRFSPAGLVAAAEQARASVLFGVPTIYQALAGALGRAAAAAAAGRLRVGAAQPGARRAARRPAGHAAGGALWHDGDRPGRLESGRGAARRHGRRAAAGGAGAHLGRRRRGRPGYRRRGAASRAAGVRRVLAEPGGHGGGIHPGRLVPLR